MFNMQNIPNISLTTKPNSTQHILFALITTGLKIRYFVVGNDVSPAFAHILIRGAIDNFAKHSHMFCIIFIMLFVCDFTLIGTRCKKTTDRYTKYHMLVILIVLEHAFSIILMSLDKFCMAIRPDNHVQVFGINMYMLIIKMLYCYINSLYYGAIDLNLHN